MPIPARYPVLMPDTPSDIVTEIGNSRALRRLKRELITGAQFQQEFMILRQERINEANRRIEHRVVEGIGEKVAEIDSELYFQMMMIYGPDCWADPDFLEDTLQKNPGLRIRARLPTRLRVDGFRHRHKQEGALRGVGPYGPEVRAGNRLPRENPARLNGVEEKSSVPVQVIEQPLAPSLRAQEIQQ